MGERLLEELGLELPDFDKMGALYREWNDKINVISRKDIDNVFEHHILHSLCIAVYLKREQPEIFSQWVKGGVSVIDVGCGGGFPGIPLASIFPNVRFTLCDSIGKKVRVASEVAAAMGMKNVECVHSRVEELPGEWDYVVSRAVTALDNFMPWVMGRFRSNIFYLKGGDMTEELQSCWKKFGPKMPSATLWKISSILEDEYFAEKLIVNLAVSKK